MLKIQDLAFFNFWSNMQQKVLWKRALTLRTQIDLLAIIPANIRLDEDVFRLRLQKTSSRRLQDVLIKTNMFALALRLQKTSSRRLQDVFKTFSRRLQDVLQRYLQDVFKTYHQVKLFLLTRLREVFNTFLRLSFPMTVIYRGICLGNTTSEKFMVSAQNLQ